MSETDRRAEYAYEVQLRSVAAEWRRVVVEPMLGSMIDNAYKQGLLPLPPLDINGDGIWTRKEPWYRAMEG